MDSRPKRSAPENRTFRFEAWLQFAFLAGLAVLGLLAGLIVPILMPTW